MLDDFFNTNGTSRDDNGEKDWRGLFVMAALTCKVLIEALEYYGAPEEIVEQSKRTFVAMTGHLN